MNVGMCAVCVFSDVDGRSDVVSAVASSLDRNGYKMTPDAISRTSTRRRRGRWDDDVATDVALTIL